MSKHFKDVVILGGGMVGLSIAHQIKETRPDLSILIIDKEINLGAHSSGRNSGVLHAGVYYEPNTIKAKVCIEGAKRLKEWCHNQGIPVLECGKVITPQKDHLDSQLNLLYDRGIANGAKISFLNEKEFYKIVPDGRTASGRALWVNDTCVVKPKIVIDHLSEELKRKGVDFLFNRQVIKFKPDKNSFLISNKSIKNESPKEVSYGYFFNTTGLHADEVARKFDIGKGLTILPFKGIYWQLDSKAPFNFKTNLYPVPDLEMPFLGVHVTPSPDGTISLGPTAIPALGRENYNNLDGIEPLKALDFFGDIIYQLIKNTGGFRKYSYEQALHGIKPLFLKSSKLLIPKLKSNHLVRSNKVGIRAQLYDKTKGTLIKDFRMENGISSTHILNAISPAFTASFSLADLILKQSNL